MSSSWVGLLTIALLAARPWTVTPQSCASTTPGRRYRSGEVWTEPPCTEMSCDRGLVKGRGCTVASFSPGSGCKEVKGTPGAKYPFCCDSVKCPRPDQCHSMRLHKTFNDQDTWTEPPCAQFKCLRGRSQGQGCPLYQSRLGCKTVKGTPGAKYPQCCDKQSCPRPDQCYSERLDKAFDDGQEWTEPPCEFFKCNKGYTQGMKCPIYQYSRCVRKEGIPGTKFPGCCATIFCPKPDQCYSERLKKIFNNGETWTEQSCGLFKCNNGRTEVMGCPGLTIGRGCVKEDGKPDAPYPGCCPKVTCPRSDQCYSSRLGKTFNEGQSWTDPPCESFVCTNGKAKPRSCPALQMDQGCVKVPGTSGAPYPTCCDKVSCRTSAQCYSSVLGKIFNDGETWTEPPCASYTCKNGRPKLKTCPVAVAWDGCEVIKGKANAPFPDCCNKQKCPSASQCYSRRMKKTYNDGDVWTEPPCQQKKCNSGFVNVDDCPWSSGFNCKKEPGTPGAAFPKCCDKFNCDNFSSF